MYQINGSSLVKILISSTTWNGEDTTRTQGSLLCVYFVIPDSKIHEANVGPTWGRQDQGGPNVGHMNITIWDVMTTTCGATS